jgi:hypothetical protein
MKVKPEMRNWRLEPTVLGKPGKTSRFSDSSLRLAWEE